MNLSYKLTSIELISNIFLLLSSLKPGSSVTLVLVRCDATQEIRCSPKIRKCTLKFCLFWFSTISSKRALGD